MESQAKTENLSAILGVEFANVKKIERLIRKLEQEEDEDEIDDRTTAIQSILEHIFDSDLQFQQMAAIDVHRRTAFSGLLRKNIFNQKSRISKEQWSMLEEQLDRLDLFCGTDFTRKPLSFAREALDKWHILQACEEGLLDLIIAMRREHNLVNIFNEAHATLLNRRRDIVITCMGPLKSSKSSFINYLLQRQVCPVGTEETTARRTVIQYGDRTVVTLRSSKDIIKESHDIKDDQHLAQVTKNLIHLTGKAREDINLCTDVVEVKLQMDELKQIQLLDIPGIDENNTLNHVVDGILAETDIIFAITPLDEALRESFVVPIQRWLTSIKSIEDEVGHVSISKGCPRICFVASKIDNFTKNKLSNLSYEDTLKHLLNRINDALHIKSNRDTDNTELSYPLIPLCSHHLHGVTEYLNSYRDFTEKSKKFLQGAVTDITYFRLNYMMQIMHDMFDCDNLQRRIKRVEQLQTMLKRQVVYFDMKVEEQLVEPFDTIYQTVLSNIGDLLEKDTISFHNRTKQKAIKERVSMVLSEQFEKAMQNEKQNIQDHLMLLVATFFSSLGLDPQQTQLVEEALQRTIIANPYNIALGQYDSRFTVMKNHAEQFWQTYFKEKFSILSPLISLDLYASMLAPFTTFFRHKQLAQQQIENLTERSIHDTLSYLRKQTLKVIEDGIKSQIISASEQLQSKDWHDISQHASDVVHYLSNNKDQVARLYLDILDKKFDLTYPKCKVSDTKISESNYSVYVAHLIHENGIDEKVAAKIIPMNEFNLQEVRYINVLNHRNIVHVYGVRKSDKIPGYYEIIMQWLPTDLSRYVPWKKSIGQLTGKCIDSILLQIVEGLAYMHGLGFFHRDIKPQNIVIQMEEPQLPLCLIADFGLIHQAPLSIKGTPGYLAPELLAAIPHNPSFITMKTDIYAFSEIIREIIEISEISREDKYIVFWIEVHQQCCQQKPENRPMCNDIIKQRHRLEEQL